MVQSLPLVLVKVAKPTLTELLMPWTYRNPNPYVKSYVMSNKKKNMEAEGGVQQLRALAAFTENRHLVPSTHTW